MKFFNDIDANTNRLMLTETTLGSRETLIPEFSSSDNVIYSFSCDEDFFVAKFYVKTRNENKHSIRNLLSLYDGESGYVTEYGIVSNDDFLSRDVFSFSKNPISGEFELTLNPSSSDSRSVTTFFIVMARGML
jgi:hypothetical protein